MIITLLIYNMIITLLNHIVVSYLHIILQYYLTEWVKFNKQIKNFDKINRKLIIN
jgi:hypothetical protein